MVAYFQTEGAIQILGKVSGTVEEMLAKAKVKADKAGCGRGAICLTSDPESIPDPDIHACLARSNYRGLKKLLDEKGIEHKVIKRGRKPGRPKKITP